MIIVLPSPPVFLIGTLYFCVCMTSCDPPIFLTIMIVGVPLSCSSAATCCLIRLICAPESSKQFPLLLFSVLTNSIVTIQGSKAPSMRALRHPLDQCELGVHLDFHSYHLCAVKDGGNTCTFLHYFSQSAVVFSGMSTSGDHDLPF